MYLSVVWVVSDGVSLYCVQCMYLSMLLGMCGVV